LAFLNVENVVVISIPTLEGPKQVGAPDREFLFTADRAFEKRYVEGNFFLLQSTVLLLGRSKGSRQELFL